SIAFVDTNTGWLVGEGGMILRTTNGGAVFVRDDFTNTIPSSFELNQNYPNPFNPVTNLSFVIRHSSFVSLKVYDILGKEVAMLIHSKLMDAGKYDIKFDGSKIPSGIYFYQLRAGNFSETKKMVLMK
ncbi:MAG: T9SS type A sorting domain-containing protein, partial [Ignavibacteriales bacterium]|nr:T9SS type A sorting domain-containing protein [Ignavibacteriales bacterium]